MTGLLSETAPDDGLAGGYTMPFPFTMHEVNKKDLKKYPYSAIGKVFFTAFGLNYVCSGASIGNKAILTAGHCVSDGAGTWFSNHMFYAGAYASRPGRKFTKKAKFVAMTTWTYTSWHNNGNYCRDVAGIIATKPVQRRVGALGHSWNYNPAETHWSAFGYPAERTRTSPEYFFDGTRMYQTEASFATQSWATCSDSSEPVPFCFGSYMTGGASGGPVIRNFDPTGGIFPGPAGGNYANGVNSHYYLGGRVAGGICSPYFDTSVHDFITMLWDQ